jgi:diguanylate cyclase (GGDEF)-like protein
MRSNVLKVIRCAPDNVGVNPQAPRFVPDALYRRAAAILAVGGLLSGLCLLPAGYLRPTWWAITYITVNAIGSLALAVVFTRRRLPPAVMLAIALVSDLIIVAVALCVRDTGGARALLTMFAIPIVFVALFTSMRGVIVQTVAATLSIGVILRLSGETSSILALHLVLAMYASLCPSVLVMGLRRHLEEAVERERCAATTDPLTAAANRRGLEAKAPELIRLSCRRAAPIGVLVGDVDHFKRVNDSFGHPTGDEVLKRVADAIRSCLRAEDVVARLGGEEFAVLAVLPPQHLAALAERIRAAVATQCSPWNVTVSIGLTWGDVDTVTPGEEIDTMWTLVDQADELMFEAKRAGRNRVYTLAASQAPPVGPG